MNTEGSQARTVPIVVPRDEPRVENNRVEGPDTGIRVSRLEREAFFNFIVQSNKIEGNKAIHSMLLAHSVDQGGYAFLFTGR